MYCIPFWIPWPSKRQKARIIGPPHQMLPDQRCPCDIVEPPVGWGVWRNNVHGDSEGGEA